MSQISRSICTVYDLYPKDNPDSYLAGFQVETVGGQTFYIDGSILFSEATELTPEGIVDAIWAKVRPAAIQRSLEINIDKTIIGRVVESANEIEVFPWVEPLGAGSEYALGDRVSHNGYIWISRVANNVWEPGVFGWSIIATATEPPPGDDPDPQGETYPAWVPWDSQPGSLYQIGDRVSHNGLNWEATVGNNHWEPGVYGWQQI